jgi:hypothetical protein
MSNNNNNKNMSQTLKQYQNDKGIVMFIDDRQNYQTTVSYCDINGKNIKADDERALKFFSHGPYLVMEFGETESEYDTN